MQRLELRLDVQRVIAFLGERDRQLALALMKLTPLEARSPSEKKHVAV